MMYKFIIKNKFKIPPNNPGLNDILVLEGKFTSYNESMCYHALSSRFDTLAKVEDPFLRKIHTELEQGRFGWMMWSVMVRSGRLTSVSSWGGTYQTVFTARTWGYIVTYLVTRPADQLPKPRSLFSQVIVQVSHVFHYV